MTNDVIAIKNHRLKAEIDLFGGAFRSITDLTGGEELVWQGCENCDWKNHDHVLFPLVCRMKDGYYEHDGTRYESSLHGFAKDSVFTPEIVTETSATVLLKSDENTLKAYPFDFELRVEYEIADNGISVTYEVKNTGRETMPYFVGGHLGINLDGTDEKEYKNDTQGNFLEFIPPITSEHGLDGNFVLPPSPTFADNIELSKAYFKKVNTFIGITEGKQKAILTKKNGGKIEFTTSAPIVALWSDENYGKYFCYEPWWRMPDEATPTREIADKKRVNFVEPGETKTCGYSLKILL